MHFAYVSTFSELSKLNLYILSSQARRAQLLAAPTTRTAVEHTRSHRVVGEPYDIVMIINCAACERLVPQPATPFHGATQKHTHLLWQRAARAGKYFSLTPVEPVDYGRTLAAPAAAAQFFVAQENAHISKCVPATD